MPKLEVGELARAMGGTLLRGDPRTVVDSYVINTRALHRGGLFFALKGSRTDGHRFLLEAAKRGAAAAVVVDGPGDQKRAPEALIQVEDTVAALGQAGALARKKLSGVQTICITGSNGKTTTKELLAAGLAGSFRVHRSRGNFNNHLGVPLSLLACPEDAEVMVLELAMSGPGEIAHLARMADPDLALITNIREVHLKFFSSLDDIAAAKGEIFSILRKDARSIVNLDDPHVRVQAARHSGVRTTFGQRADADFYLEELVNQFVPGASLSVRHRNQQHRIQLRIGGASAAFNCLAALTVAVTLGADPAEVIPKMERLEAVPGRGKVHRLKGDILLIDDSYNSSPSALASILETLQLSKPAGRKLLVMGDMLELGPIEGALHRAAGKRAASAGVELLVTVGSLSRQSAESARRSGVSEVHQYADSTKAANPLLDSLKPGDMVVVKGSRAMKMERVVDRLLEAFGGGELMFYHLLYPLHELFGAFNVFQYITFRTAMATMTALLVSLLLGPRMIRRLRDYQIGQEIREEGPSTHHSKRGTPTMGGLLIITAVILPTLLWADLGNIFVWTAVAATLLFGAIGFTDDYMKLARKRNLGLSARAKFSTQLLVALALGLFLMWLAARGQFSTTLSIPFFKTFTPDLGWGYPLFVILVLTGAANGVNLTDGLDGLAIGSLLIAWSTFAILSYVVGHAIVAEYLAIQNVKGAGELTVFCGSVVGASLGFLWFNSHPAEIFMGDVGSMALGGALGTTAILIKQEVMLVLVGGLFVVEALSVIVQVFSFKTRGRRVFRMSPLHHHFELAGWSESKVVIRFWIIAILFALLALATLKLR